MVKCRSVFSVALLSTLSLCAQTPQSQQTPVTTLHSNSRLVVVDVVVTDKDGNVVKGLPLSDFTISEDGKPQAITGFEEHTVANTTSVPLAPVPKPRPGQFSNAVAPSGELPVNILLIDALNSEWENQADFKRRALKYMSTMPHGQRIAVLVLSHRLRMVQNFSDDADKSLDAVKNFQPGIEVEPSFTNRFEATLNAFTQIARATSAYPGRKNLIWVSAAFPLDLTPQRDSNGEYPETATFVGRRTQEVSNLLATNKVALYPVDIRGLVVTSPDASVPSERIVRDYKTNTSEGIVRAYSRYIELKSSAITETQDTMREIAALTGGHAYFNKNDLGGAIGKAVELGSSYYTISYSPTNKSWNGKFRDIGVKLARKNLALAYRRGYYAVDEDKPQLAESLERSVQVAMADLSPLSTGIIFNASAMLRDASGAVTVSYDLDGRQLRLHNSDGQPIAGQLTFAIAAWNARGKLLAQTNDFWELPGDAETIAKIEKEGWAHQQKINVPLEAARVRVAVQDRLSGKIGAVDIPLAQSVERAGAAKSH